MIICALHVHVYDTCLQLQVRQVPHVPEAAAAQEPEYIQDYEPRPGGDLLLQGHLRLLELGREATVEAERPGLQRRPQPGLLGSLNVLLHHRVLPPVDAGGANMAGSQEAGTELLGDQLTVPSPAARLNGALLQQPEEGYLRGNVRGRR